MQFASPYCQSRCPHLYDPSRQGACWPSKGSLECVRKLPETKGKEAWSNFQHPLTFGPRFNLAVKPGIFSRDMFLDSSRWVGLGRMLTASLHPPLVCETRTCLSIPLYIDVFSCMATFFEHVNLDARRPSAMSNKNPQNMRWAGWMGLGSMDIEDRDRKLGFPHRFRIL